MSFKSYRFLSHLKSLYLGISSSIRNHSVSTSGLRKQGDDWIELLTQCVPALI